MPSENEKLFSLIHEEVQKAGIFPHISGCKYIAYSIYLIFENSSLMYQIMQLYKQTALQYDTTYTAVEHCIRHAISSAYRYHPETIKSFVKLTDHQPKNSEFICGLAEKIRIQMIAEEKDNFTLR